MGTMSSRPAALLTICAVLALIAACALIGRGVVHSGLNSEFQHRTLMNYHPSNINYGWNFDDPRSVDEKSNADAGAFATIKEPLHVCNRPAPIPHQEDVEISMKYAIACPLLHTSPENTTLLILDGYHTFGRTGNNFIEFLHAMQYAKEHGMVVGIMQGTWATHLITEMWMAIQDDDIHTWSDLVEKALCVKILSNYEETKKYKEVKLMETRDLFLYRHDSWKMGGYVEFQSNILRTLYRAYNRGAGVDMRHYRVKNMCSVYDAIFGSDANSETEATEDIEKESPMPVYSVIHSRTMESAGANLLAKLSRVSGCDPTAALNMEPEYVKAILQPLGMLEHPIVVITDNQRPEVVEKLLADPDIGPQIRLIPDEVSWVGGDITMAALADVFIGNPASSFSGFIAKSRVALGYGNNYLLRKKNKDGSWVDVCDERCIFDKGIMNMLA